MRYFISFILFFAAFNVYPYNENDPLKLTASLDTTLWASGQNGTLTVVMELPDGFHAYEEQLKIKSLLDNVKVSKPSITNIIKFYDKTSKKERNGFKDKAVLTAFVELEEQSVPLKEFKFQLTYQACSNSFCLFPKNKEIVIPVNKDDQQKNKLLEQTQDLNFNITQLLNSNSLILSFLLVFLAGFLTSFTPCIFPMIPITLSILGHGADKRTRSKNFLLSLSYVHGIALTYATLGLIAASGGFLFGSLLGNPYILSFICIVMLFMSLSMFGLFEIQLPSFFRNKFTNKKTDTNYTGAFISGLFAGLVASPCVGPILVTLLTYVSTQKNLLLGFFLLFTYAMGLGLIFLFLGLSNEFLKFLPRSGGWMNNVKYFFAFLMLASFYYYLNLLVPENIFYIILGLGMIILSAFFKAFEKHPNGFKNNLKKSIWLTVFYLGLLYIANGLFDFKSLINQRNTKYTQQLNLKSWNSFSANDFEAAIQSGKPVIVDFWADWCAACHELEEKTFSHELVKQELQRFILFKFDATRSSDELDALKIKYNIKGLPTVLFFNKNGKWESSLNLTEFENYLKFLERLKSL